MVAQGKPVPPMSAYTLVAILDHVAPPSAENWTLTGALFETPFQDQYRFTVPRRVPPSDTVIGTNAPPPGLLLASPVFPCSPILIRLPLGLGSLVKAKAGAPMSIRREVDVSFVQLPLIGLYLPYSLNRWKSYVPAFANRGSYPKLRESLEKLVRICQSIKKRSGSRSSFPDTKAPSVARILL